MDIINKLEDVKSYLGELKRKYRFKKARMTREDAVELQTTLAKCRGKLEICKKDLNRSINNQSRNICEGLELGTDTIIQEQILWDAAIGYMLVRDAIFALETITSYDAVSHAYEMLDTAMKQVAGRKNGFPKSMKIGSTKERNAYGYITSSTALKDKEALLDSFFESLKRSGDIEQHLADARTPAAQQAERRYAYTQDPNAQPAAASEMDARKARLDGIADGSVQTEAFDGDLNDIADIHPPVDSL